MESLPEAADVKAPLCIGILEYKKNLLGATSIVTFNTLTPLVRKKDKMEREVAAFGRLKDKAGPTVGFTVWMNALLSAEALSTRDL